MFNKVILIGNLTRDIELRYLQNANSSALARTGLAVNRRFTANGERREETCFIDITFWGRTAEIANQYLRRGSKVLIEGRLQFEQWQDQNGQNRSRHSVNVESMEMLDTKNSNPADNNSNSYNQNYNQNNNYQQGQNNNYQQNNRQNSYNSQNNPQNLQEQKVESYKEDIPEIDIDEDNDVIPF